MALEPAGLADLLADVPEAAGLVHHDPAARIVTAELCLGDLVAVAPEAVFGRPEALVGPVGLVPLHVVDEGHDREGRVQRGDAAPQRRDARGLDTTREGQGVGGIGDVKVTMPQGEM